MKRLLLITTGLFVLLVFGLFAASLMLIPGAASVPVVQPRVQMEPTAENRPLTVADIASTGKPQFLNAYATWCPYCKQNDPALSAVRQQFKDRVDFINLNVDGEGVLDVAAPYTITGVTQYVLIDASGKIIEKWFGSITEDMLSESIAAYLQSI